MSDPIQSCAEVLVEAGYSTQRIEIPGDDAEEQIDALAFEDATVLGFIVAYDTPDELIASWTSDRDRIAMRHRSVFQAARQKAWNAYLVLVAREPADYAQSLALGQIEENLEAMRKIARAGVVASTSSARTALLPLLPFRAAPSLDPIEMRKEIQSRCTELENQIVAAFLSNANEEVVMQLLEDDK